MSNEILDFVLARQLAHQEGRRPRCWGRSSDALVLYALGKGPRPTIPGRSDHPGSWSGSEMGQNYPHDESDLGACELSYEMAPESVREAMLPVLDEFRAWVREGKNRYGEQVRRRSVGMTLRTDDFEVSL